MFGFARRLLSVVPGAVIALAASTSLATTLDLTGGGSGTINDGVFSTLENYNVPTGTGVFKPFLRVQANGVEQGYNTDRANKDFQFDEKAGIWTHSLKFSDLSLVNGYYQFALDLGEPATDKKSLITLDMLQLFSTSNSDINGATYNAANQAAPFGASATKIWDLDSPSGAGGSDNLVKLDYNLVGQGNGRADLLFLLPESYFAGLSPSDYIVFYTKFGSVINADGTFEEWAVLVGPPTPIPLPASLMMIVAAFAGLGFMGRKRSGPAAA